MASRLVAVQAPPARLAGIFDEVWSDGDAVLPLPWPPDPSAAVTALAGAHAHATVTATTRTAPLIRTDHGHGTALAGDVALVVATSGTTGAPKGVLLSHAALEASTTASLARLDAKAGDRFAIALPVHHIAGIQVLLRARRCATEPVVADPSDTASIVGAGGDHISLVAAQLDRILAHDPSSLGQWRSVLVGGGPVPDDLVARAGAHGGRVLRSYGMTETAGGCVYDGVPLDGVEVGVQDDGRLRIRGAVLASGYVGDDAPLVDEQGWFVTRDFGRVDDDGRVEVHGRADDVVVTGGENVPAAAVEAEVRSHPSVRDAAVVGWPDERWGAVVVAVVEPHDGAEVGLEELRAWVVRSCPTSWAPRRLVVTRDLPRGPLGKPDRHRIETLLHRELVV